MMGLRIFRERAQPLQEAGFFLAVVEKNLTAAGLLHTSSLAPPFRSRISRASSDVATSRPRPSMILRASCTCSAFDAANQVRGVVAFEFEAGAGLGQRLQHIFDVLERIAEHDILVLEMLALP